MYIISILPPRQLRIRRPTIANTGNRSPASGGPSLFNDNPLKMLPQSIRMDRNGSGLVWFINADGWALLATNEGLVGDDLDIVQGLLAERSGVLVRDTDLEAVAPSRQPCGQVDGIDNKEIASLVA